MQRLKIRNYFKNYLKQDIKTDLAIKHIHDEEYISKMNFINNSRLLFNYYNLLRIKKSNAMVEVLDQYFHEKKLFRIRQKNLSMPLNVKNIAYLKDDYFFLIASRKITIIVTTYNINDLVKISIQSLLDQTYKNIEIILVDDGSTDDTFGILQKFKNSYPDKIKLIKLHQNHGAYVAKNIGMTYAAGELITFHDADDWAHPQRIEEHVKVHLKSKKIKFSISKLVRLTEDGYFIAKEVYPLDRLSMVSLMIDRSLLDEVGYFKTHRLGSDSEYFERLKNFTKHKWERIDKVLMLCAHRANSLTTSADTGVEGFGKNNKRQHYWNQWNKWHTMLKKARRKPFVGFDRDKYKYELIS